MTKKESIKFIAQIIVSIASAVLTALGATSCMGYWCYVISTALELGRLLPKGRKNGVSGEISGDSWDFSTPLEMTVKCARNDSGILYILYLVLDLDNFLTLKNSNFLYSLR